MASDTLENRESVISYLENSFKKLCASLDVLIEQHDKEQSNYNKKLCAELIKSVLQFVDKMKTEQMSPAARTYLNIIECKLTESSYSNPKNRLIWEKTFTATEIYIIELIKRGKRSKEIAELLNVSTATISFHRNNIRKKLGLNKKKQNLFSFLNSIG